jgi:hypothetical protein
MNNTKNQTNKQDHKNQQQKTRHEQGQKKPESSNRLPADLKHQDHEHIETRLTR